MSESETNRRAVRSLRATRPRALNELPPLAPGQSPADLLAKALTGGKGRRSGNKFGAVREGGYDSKAEARYANKLRTLKEAGVIADWLEQVPIKLSEGITYRVDFMVLESDGSVRFVEVKGHPTPEWKLKYKLLRNERPEIFKRLEVVR